MTNESFGYISQIKDLTVISKPSFFYLTSSIYPLELIDNLSTSSDNIVGRSNTADDLGVYRFNQDNVKTSLNQISGTLKVALKLYSYSRGETDTDKVLSNISNVTGILREVLLKFNIGFDNLLSSLSEISGNMKSSLILYSFYKEERLTSSVYDVQTTSELLPLGYSSFIQGSVLEESYTTFARSFFRTALASSESSLTTQQDSSVVILNFTEESKEIDAHNVVLSFGNTTEEKVWNLNPRYVLKDGIVTYTGNRPYSTKRGYESTASLEIENYVTKSFQDQDMQQWQGFINAVDELTGVTDWVLDTANNQIVYTKPSDQPCLTPESCPTHEYFYQASGNLFSNAIAASQVTIDELVADVPTRSYSFNSTNCPSRPTEVLTCSVVYNAEHNKPYTYTVTVSTVQNPNYDESAEEDEDDKKTLPLETVAQKIISNASSSNQAISLLAETYIEAVANSIFNTDVLKQFIKISDLIPQFELNKVLVNLEEPKVVINEYTTVALDFENNLVDKIPTTIWNTTGTAIVEDTNVILGKKSLETKALGDSLYTNSNIITGGSTPFTIEFYALIKGGSSDWRSLLSKTSNLGAGEQFFGINALNGNKVLYLRQANAGGELENTYGTYNVKNNEVNKFTFTYDGSAQRIFINDKLDSVRGLNSGFYTSSDQPFKFLDSLNPSYGSRYRTDGIIDNINIHDGIATKVRDPDPYEEYLVVDLAFDGENNSTKIVDNGKVIYGDGLYDDQTNVVSHLSFENGISDSFNNNWTLVGGTSITTEDKKFGTSSLKIPPVAGSTLYMNNLVPKMLTKDFCIEIWYKPTNSINNFYSFVNTYGYSNTSETNVMIGINEGLFSATFITPLNGVDASVNINQWYHIAYTRHGNTFRLFKNGVLIGSGTSSESIRTDAMFIGMQPYDTSWVRSGYYDEFRWVIGEPVYTSNFVVRDTPYRYKTNMVWSVNGNAKLSTAQKFDGFSSLYLDGTSGTYIKSSTTSNINIDGLSKLTIEFMYNRISDVNTACMVGLYVGLYERVSLYSRTVTNPCVYINGSVIIDVNIPTLKLNTDIKYRLVIEGETYSLYINDILVGTTKNQSILVSPTVFIGQSGGGSEFFHGYVKNLKIYNDIAIIPENPSGKIQLDFDNNVVDKYNNSTWINDGVIFDQVNSIKGSSAYFSVPGTRLSSGLNNNLNFDNKFSISFDARKTADTVYPCMVGSSTPVWQANNQNPNISFHNTNTANFSFNVANVDINNSLVGQAFKNNWYNFNLYRSSNVLQFKINDIIQGMYNINNTVSSFNFNEGGSTYIGTTGWSVNGSHNFIGNIDNFKSLKHNLIVDKEEIDGTEGIWVQAVADCMSTTYQKYDFTNTSLPTYDEFYKNTVDFGALFYNRNSPVRSEKGASAIVINKSVLNKKFSVLAANGCNSGSDIYVTIEILNSSNNVIAALKWQRVDYYSNYMYYGPNLNTMTQTAYNGSYPASDGDLYFKEDKIEYIHNSNRAQVNTSFVYNVNLSDAKSIRITNLSAYEDYTSCAVVFILKKLSNIVYKDFIDSVVDKPAVHLPLETNNINIGFTPLTINSVGSPIYSIVDDKKCIKFEHGKYLTIDSNNIFNLGTSSDFYIEFDINLISFLTYNMIITNNNSWSNGSQSIWITNTGKIAIQGYNGLYKETQYNIDLNNWYNIKIFRTSSSVVTIVINDLITERFNITDVFNFSISNMYMGTSGWATNSDYLNGYISNFKMFVDTSTIPETYNDKKVLDLDFKPTRKSYLFKDNNNKCVIHPININQRDYLDSKYCCTFNGNNQYLELGKNNLLNFGNDDFVLEIIFKLYVINKTNPLIANAVESNGISGRVYVCIATNNKFQFGYYSSGSYLGIEGGSANINEIYKMTVIRENNIFTLKVNDEIIGTLERTEGIDLNQNNGTWIGRILSGDFLSGTIYSVKVLRNTTDLTLLEGGTEEEPGGGEEKPPLTMSINNISDLYNPPQGNVLYVTGKISNASVVPTVSANINDININPALISVTANSVIGDYDYSIGILTDSLESDQVLVVTAISGGEEVIVNRSFKVIKDKTLDRASIDSFGTSWYQVNTIKPVLIRKYNEEPMLYFDGYGCLYSTNNSWKFGLDMFTIELDFLITELPINSSYPYHILSYGKDYNMESWYSLEILSTGVVRFNISKGTAIYIDSLSSLIKANTKYKLAVTRDSNYTVRIFLDGVKIAEKIDKTSLDALSQNQWYSDYSGIMYLGRSGTTPNDNDNPIRHFKGYMKNVYIAKNKCLYTSDYTPTEYSFSIDSKSLLTFTDDDVGFTSKVDSFNSDITWTNTGCTVVDKQLVFSNNTNRLVSSDNNMYMLDKNNWTLDLSFIPTQLITETALIDMRQSNTSYKGLLIKQSAADPTSITIYLGDNTATQSYTYTLNTGVNSLSLNSLCHLKIVRSVGDLILFLNGVRISKTTIDTREINTSNKVCLGNDLNFNKGFVGKIKQFRIINGTASDVHAFPIIEGETLK